MATDRSSNTTGQAKRSRRKRTQEDRQRRAAAFARPKRGRPIGTTLAFFEDDDRFAVAMVFCAEAYMGLPRYLAAYAVVALISKRPIDARIAEGILLHLSGGPDNATLKGKSQGLIAKCDQPRTVAEANWIASSAAFLGMFIKLAAEGSPDPVRSRAVVEALSELGWTAMLKTITAKLSSIAKSNFPPDDQPLTRRANLLAESLRTNQKT
ncbi:hypothetical protein [Bradyrhizobium australafricanum]|uniref:hypothetical protein n=1 Tax=Bradyrhizobium australafricanum TaxID=2821406 RepID=UPI001CE36B51|nr:hypothetical protein [Bradyrhizobium australafricanum]MCA6099200.1 hypothetical protein [Bradyrhizobium australafricanum]